MKLQYMHLYNIFVLPLFNSRSGPVCATLLVIKLLRQRWTHSVHWPSCTTLLWTTPGWPFRAFCDVFN